MASGCEFMADEGSSLFLCPHCGAFVSESSSTCPNCGNALEVSDDEELELDDLQIMEDTVEEETGRQGQEGPSPDSESNGGEDNAEPVTLFMCSVCGAFTGEDAEICPQCGASMLEEENEPETLPGIPAGQPEADVLDMLVEAEPPGPKIIPETDENLLEDLKHIESAEDVVNFIDSIIEDEPEPVLEPELELEPPAEMLPRRSGKTDELLSMLIMADDYGDSQEEAVNTVEGMVNTPKIEKKSDDTIAMCNHCGAFVSESAKVCNVCGQSLTDSNKFIPEGDTSPDENREEQAENVIRSLLGVDQDEVLDSEEDRFQADGSLGLCTVCGAFISEYADTCTVCGTHIDEMPEFVPSVDIKDKLTDNAALAICPHCGAFVQEGATECMNCVKPIPDGAKLDMVDMDGKEDDTDKASNLLRNFLGVEKSLEMEPTKDQSMSGLDICPDCGAFVSLNATSCPVCGNSLFDEPDKPAIAEEQKMSCPNCGSRIAQDSTECPLCGMVFARDDEFVLEPEGTGEDITDLLEKELEESIRHLEQEAGVELPELKSPDEKSHEVIEKIPTEDNLWVDDGLDAQEMEEDLSDMLVEMEQEEEEPVKEPREQIPETEAQIAEPAVQIPAGEYDYTGHEESEIPEPGEEESFEEHPKESGTPAPEDEILNTPDEDFNEPLEFIETEPVDTEITETPESDEELVEEEIVEKIPVDRDISRFGTEARPMAKPANWATGIYVSALALCLTVISYIIAPGDYSQGLAVVFGTFSLMGVYLLLTEKGTFFKGDFKHAWVFLSGCLLAAWILIHWPLGILVSDSGFLSQPMLDNISLSISILLISVGILWIRARIRYVFTWLSGIILLFLAMAVEAAYSGWNSSFTSPSLLISGLGASLVFISLIFFMYERAINTSIESDIVRGDAYYLRHDYRGALASYDSALAKSQIKRVEVLGRPINEYDVPWYSKGSALILMGEFEEGIKCLDMALAINPNNEVTWVNKGNAHSKLGEHDVAQECYERAIEVNPFYEIAWNNLGNVMARRRMYVEALKHYNRAIKINMKYDDAWINKGYVLAKMGKREQAVKCLNHVGSRAKIEMPGTVPEAKRATET